METTAQTFELFDDKDNTSHGHFETLQKARMAASFDRLNFFSVWLHYDMGKAYRVFSHEGPAV